MKIHDDELDPRHNNLFNIEITQMKSLLDSYEEKLKEPIVYSCIEDVLITDISTILATIRSKLESYDNEYGSLVVRLEYFWENSLLLTENAKRAEDFNILSRAINNKKHYFINMSNNTFLFENIKDGDNHGE